MSHLGHVPHTLPCPRHAADTVHLPVAAPRTPAYEQLRRTTGKAITVLGRLGTRCSLRFAVTTGAGRPVAAWWALRGDDQALDEAETALRYLATHLTWADLGAAIATAPLPLGPVRHHLLRAPVSDGVSCERACAWDALHRLWPALRRRARPAQHIHLLLDEWQQCFPTPTLAAALGERRRYGLRQLLASQNLAQRPTRLRDTALANTGAVECFRTGPADAALLDERFPTLTRAQLQRLPAHHLVVTTGETDFVVYPTPPLALSPQGQSAALSM